MARIVRTVSTKVVSKSYRVKTPTRSGFTTKTVPVKVKVKITRVRVIP